MIEIIFIKEVFFDIKIPKRTYQIIVKNENFTSTIDIMESIKSMFAGILNENVLKPPVFLIYMQNDRLLF